MHAHGHPSSFLRWPNSPNGARSCPLVLGQVLGQGRFWTGFGTSEETRAAQGSSVTAFRSRLRSCLVSHTKTWHPSSQLYEPLRLPMTTPNAVSFMDSKINTLYETEL